MTKYAEAIESIRAIVGRIATHSGFTYFIVAALGIVMAMLSMPSDRLIMGGDSPNPELDPNFALSKSLTSWAGFAGFGEDNALKLGFVTICLIDVALSAVGIPVALVNHAWPAIILAIQGCSVVWLFRLLFPSVDSAWSGLAGAVAILNPWVLLEYHAPYPALNLAVAAAPALAASLLSYLRSKRTLDLLIFILWAVIETVANLNPAYVIEQCAMIVVICLVRGIRHSKRNVITAIIALGAYVAVNIPFWVPIARFSLGSFPKLVSAGQEYTDDTVAVTSTFSHLGNSVRLVGGYLFFNNVGKAPFLDIGHEYISNPWLILASSLLPILAFSALFIYYRSIMRPIVWAICALAALALFLAKGESAPLGSGFTFLIQHFHYFQAFRDSFGKFGWIVMYCYACTAPLSAAYLFALARASPLKWVALLPAAIILVSAFPLFTGHMYWPQIFAKVPEPYYRLAAWANNLPDQTTRIVEFPVAQHIFDTYSWGYVGAGLNTNIIRASIVSRQFDFGQPETKGVNDAVSSFETSIGTGGLAPLLGLLSVTHAISDPTVDLDYNTHFHASIASSDTFGLKVAIRAGRVSALKVLENLVNPRIYAATRIWTGPKNLEQVAAVCRIQGSCKKSVFLERDEIASLDAKNIFTAAFDRISSKNAAGRFYTSLPVAAHSERQIKTRASGLTITDYGNVTEIASPLFRTTVASPIVYAGKKPVVVSIDLRLAGDHHSFTTTPSSRFVGGQNRRKATFTLCSSPESTTTHQFDVRTPNKGRPLLLALAYTADADADNWMNIVDGRGEGAKGSWFLPLSSGFQGIARLVQFESPSAAIVLGVRAHSKASCLHVRYLALAISKSTDWKLIGTSLTLHATPLYVASNADAIKGYANRRYSYQSRALNPRHRIIIIPAEPGWWSDVQRIDSSGEERLIGYHEYFEHLMPGVSYILYVNTHSWSAQRPHIALLSTTGQIIYNRWPRVVTSNARLAIRFDNPPDSSGVVAYVYGDAARALAPPGALKDYVMPSSTEPSLYIREAAPISAPSLRVQVISPVLSRVFVSNAPRVWVLVFNDSYDPGWNIRSTNGLSTLHIAANFSNNAWVIKGHGNAYTLEIYFEPERLRIWSLVLGLSGIISGVLASAWVEIRLRR